MRLQLTEVLGALPPAGAAEPVTATLSACVVADHLLDGGQVVKWIEDDVLALEGAPARQIRRLSDHAGLLYAFSGRLLNTRTAGYTTPRAKPGRPVRVSAILRP